MQMIFIISEPITTKEMVLHTPVYLNYHISFLAEFNSLHSSANQKLSKSTFAIEIATIKYRWFLLQKEAMMSYH